MSLGWDVFVDGVWDGRGRELIRYAFFKVKKCMSTSF